MDLKTYLAGLTTAERTALADRCGITLGHLNNVRYGVKSCAPELAIAIERESAGAIRCEELCPDVDWAFIRGTAATADGAHP